MSVFPSSHPSKITSPKLWVFLLRSYTTLRYLTSSLSKSRPQEIPESSMAFQVGPDQPLYLLWYHT